MLRSLKLPVLFLIFFFTACGNDGPTAPARSVTLLYPNGGEVFHFGDTLEFKWQAVDISNVDISIERLDGRGYYYIASRAPAMSGTFRWRVSRFDLRGFLIPPGAYSVDIGYSGCTQQHGPGPGGTCIPIDDQSDGAWYIED